jgi:hypothetical protein
MLAAPLGSVMGDAMLPQVSSLGAEVLGVQVRLAAGADGG